MSHTSPLSHDAAVEYVASLRIYAQQKRNAADDYARKARNGTLAMRLAYQEASIAMISSAERATELAAFWEQTLAEYPDRALAIERFACQ